MGEGNHVTQGRTTNGRKPKIALIAAGTALTLLAGGVLFQFFRAETAPAGEDSSARKQTRQAGKANVAGGKNKGTPVARVTDGDSVYLIDQDELARECIQRVGKDVLDNMINRAVIQLACEREGVVVTEAEVEQEIVRIAKEFDIPVQTWLQMLQSERNLTPTQYRRDVIWPMLALKKLAGETVKISDADLQKAFARHYGPRVKARMIMLENFRRAQKVWEEVNRKPEDFERLARKHSVEPNSRALGGSIHPIPRHSGNEELEQAAFKLKPGEISGIIQVGTPARYVILKCEGRTEQIVEKPTPEIRQDLEKQLRKEKVQREVAQVFDKLKKKSRIDNYLTNTTTGDLTNRIRQTSGSKSNRNIRRAAGRSGGKSSYPPRVTPRGARKRSRR